MTRSLLELAREAVRLRTVVDDCLAVEYHDATTKFVKTYFQFQSEATPARIIELCEALEALVKKLDAVHADPKYMTVWQIAQLHQGSYTGPQYADELERARRALKGE